ncbi:hypothetical protein BC829DRAFT_417887 [Chytridium lagenaria]|nr:hypothetical protein BC829DRAFT_417887 [Chytridium lagenaria]
MTTTYKFFYFPIRGLAEISRAILFKSGVEWTEENPEWPAAKEEMPFGQMPLLIEYLDGKEVFRIAQSHAIERYVARKHGLAGASLKETAYLESIAESWFDVVNAFGRVRMAASTENAAKVKDAEFNTKIAGIFKYHDEILQKNGNTGFYLGSSITFVEITAYFTLERGEDIDKEAFDALKAKFPGICRLYDAVRADPAVGGYILGTQRTSRRSLFY